MKNRFLLWSLVFCLCLIGTQRASAQLDRVFDKKGDNVSGTVEQTNPQGIQLLRAGNAQAILSGDISKIQFEGEGSSMTRGRAFALDGQYDQALDELKKVSLDSLPRDLIKADAVYYLIYCDAKLALAGQGKKDEAVKKLMTFVSHPQYKNSWHFYEATRLLGDLELALNNPDKAFRMYDYLTRSKASADTKIEATYLKGLVHLKKNDAAKALEEFEKIIGLKAQTTETARLQVLSKAGKAVAIALGGKSAEGLELVKTLIADLNPADVETAARIYNAQGASYEAGGDIEGAIFSYLHTHLMFSAQPDAHAEALKKLVELWPQVGKPERAAEARQELQQRYPGF